MGNDGGSIPGRQDLVKEKQKEKRAENKDLVKQSQSKFCALTKEPLKKPIVGDRLGFLYNKETLIQSLIEKRLPKTFNHINSLKDIKDLNVTFSDDEKILCPITMILFSGMNSFSFIWKCGCVLSKKALEELSIKNNCIHCGASVDLKTDLVSLNYTSKEKQAIFNKIIEEKIKIRENKNKEKQNRINTINMLSKKRENENDDQIKKADTKEENNFFDINSNKKSRNEYY